MNDNQDMNNDNNPISENPESSVHDHLMQQIKRFKESSAELRVNRSDIYNQVNGEMHFAVDGDHLMVTHTGGEVIGISKAFMEDADPEYFKVEGNTVILPGFKLRIFKHYDELELYLARVEKFEEPAAGTEKEEK